MNRHQVLHLLRFAFTAVALTVTLQIAPAPLFDDDSVLDVQLTGPLTSIIKNKQKQKRTELPFTLLANGVEHSVKVRVRGKSRLRVCKFPPLRINLSDRDTAQTVFAGQDKLKLVTHCGERNSSQVDTLQEYVAYRLFSVITEVSYRVRLLRITYIDTERHDKYHSRQKYAFFIEAKKAMAKRAGGKLAHVDGVTLASLDKEHMARVYIFQYLIGNTDWSLVTATEDDECCHNGDLLDIGEQRYYVPYDFDLAGLVNARYSNPDPSLRIKKVTQRLYRGFCTPRTTLQTGLDTVLMHKDEILNIVSQLPGLSQKELKSSRRYLEKFFILAGDQEKMLRTFEKRCLRSGK